jgi:hypothetical protein
MRPLNTRHEGDHAHRDKNWRNKLEMSARKHVYPARFYPIRFWMQVNNVLALDAQSFQSAWYRRSAIAAVTSVQNSSLGNKSVT